MEEIQDAYPTPQEETTNEDFDAIEERQKGKCAICGCVPRKTRLCVNLLAAEQDGRCFYCERQFSSPGHNEATLEHLYGRKNKDPFLRSCVVSACRGCNEAKGVRDNETRKYGTIRPHVRKTMERTYSQRSRKAVGIWIPNTIASNQASNRRHQLCDT